MAFWKVFMFFIVTMGTVTPICCKSVNNNTSIGTELLSDLFNGYNPLVLPTIDPGKRVTVTISMKIRKLDSIYTKHQYISVYGWVFTKWKEERLIWNSSQYGNIDFISLNPEDVWLPDYILLNTVNDYYFNDIWYKRVYVKVRSDGSATWSPGGNFKADCPIDIQYFPFDDQICIFRFENWVYPADLVNLTHPPDAAEQLLAYISPNGEWNILESYVLYKNMTYGTVVFPHVIFGIHVQRKPLFYVMNIILLSVLFAFLVLLLFILPVESGEKMSMGVTLLLAFSVFILMINESVPETSTAVPIIIIYLVCLMALTTLAIFESVIVLYCYHHSGDAKPPELQMIYSLAKISKLKRRKNKSSDSVLNGSVVVNRGAQNDHQFNRDDWKFKLNDQKFKKEWQKFSKKIDKCCFWVFLGIFVSLFLTLIVVLPITKTEKNLQQFVEELQSL